MKHLHRNAIKELATNFWKGMKVSYPIQYSFLEGAAFAKYPVNITRLNKLTLSKVIDWLSKHNCSCESIEEDKSLFGLLFMQKGHAFIFLDGTSEIRESLFTLAHELAHYIIEIEHPKRLAVNIYGSQIEDVFDGKRVSTVAEQVSVITSQIDIQPYINLLEKEEMDGISRIKVWEAESSADILALELIAPEDVVKKTLNSLRIQIRFYDLKEKLPELLSTYFYLPESISHTYATALCYKWCRGGPSFSDWLGL